MVPPPLIPSYHDQWTNLPSIPQSFSSKPILKVGPDIVIDGALSKTLIMFLLSLAGHSHSSGGPEVFADGSVFLDLLQRVSPDFFPRSTIRGRRDPPFWKSNLQTIYLLLMRWGGQKHLQDWSCSLPLPDINLLHRDERSLLSFCLTALFACWKSGGSLRIEMDCQLTPEIMAIMKYYENETVKWPYTPATYTSNRSPPPQQQQSSASSSSSSPNSWTSSLNPYYTNNTNNNNYKTDSNYYQRTSKSVPNTPIAAVSNDYVASPAATTPVINKETQTAIRDLQSNLEDLKLERDKSDNKYHSLLDLIRTFSKRINPFFRNGISASASITDVLDGIEEVLVARHSQQHRLWNENKLLKQKVIPRLKEKLGCCRSSSKRLKEEIFTIRTHRSRLRKKLRKLWKRFHLEGEESKSKENKVLEELNQRSILAEATQNSLLKELQEVRMEKEAVEGQLRLKDLLLKDYKGQLEGIPDFEEMENLLSISMAREEMLKRDLQEGEVKYEILERGKDALELEQRDLLEISTELETIKKEKKILQRIIYENDKTQKQRSFSLKDEGMEIPPPIFYSNPTSPLTRES